MLARYRPVWSKLDLLAFGMKGHCCVVVVSGDGVFPPNQRALGASLNQKIQEVNPVLGTQGVPQRTFAQDDTSEELAQKVDKAMVARVNWLQDFEKGTFLDPELVSPKIENPGILNQMIGFGRFRKGPDEGKKK